MDFIKNLSLHDPERDKQSAAHESELQSPPPPPPSAIEGPQHESLLDKISTAFGGEHNTTAPAPSQPQPVATTATNTDEHGHAHKLAHKISGMFDSAEERERKAAEAAALARAQEEARLKAEEEARKAREEEERRHRYHPHHLLEKMGLSEGHETQQVPVPPPKEEKKESILGKLGLHHDEPVPPRPPPKEESLLDKIGSSFGHKRVEEEPPKPQTLGEKIQATLQHAHGEDDEKKIKEKKGFMAKMKVALGGEEEEVDEDALDKGMFLWSDR